MTQVQYGYPGEPERPVVANGVRRATAGWPDWNTTAVPNGTYTLQSVASYAGGVSGTSPGITITVAN